MTMVQPLREVNSQWIAAEHPVKLTSLIYLREALLEENYEIMQELVAIAKEFGAGYWDIQIALMKNPENRKSLAA